jgi:hypothetical protein
VMRFSFASRDTRRPEVSVSQYGIGQRIVELVRLSDGCTRWICSCERYRASAETAQGPWCKHVAKAAAIRSIERLTGERVISRATAHSARLDLSGRSENRACEPSRELLGPAQRTPL